MNILIVEIGLYLTYVLVLLAAAATIIFPIIQAIDNPSGLLKSGIGILAILVVFGLAYMISGNEVTAAYHKYDVTPGSSKLVGGGLISLYLLGILAFGSIIYSEISKMLK